MLATILLGGLLTSTGCTDKSAAATLPKTYPVTGKIVVSGRPLPEGARIQFHAQDPNLLARGRKAADGSFSLTLLFAGWGY